ncbi:MAG: hypothetical protein KAR13_21440 [Desulfobulbaceae bacterium]|nr:hypothetical protein [Desulfobulbaceae bacterium]
MSEPNIKLVPSLMISAAATASKSIFDHLSEIEGGLRGLKKHPADSERRIRRSAKKLKSDTGRLIRLLVRLIPEDDLLSHGLSRDTLKTWFKDK